MNTTKLLQSAEHKAKAYTFSLFPSLTRKGISIAGPSSEIVHFIFDNGISN